MKIAIINTTAKTGSIGKIAYGQYERLRKDGHAVRLYYGRCDSIRSDCVQRIDTDAEIAFHVFLARLTGLHGYYSSSATKRLIKELESFGPDLVQLYNLHGYYLNVNMLLKYLGKKEIPVVYSMLDEYPYLGRCCYSFACDGFQNGCRNCTLSRKTYPGTWFFRFSEKFNRDKKQAYGYLKNICYAGPEWVVQRARRSSLLKGKKFYCVDEYVDTDVVFMPVTDYRFTDRELTCSMKKIVLSVAPYSDPRKGGKLFMQLAQLCRKMDDYLFVYIGMDVKGVRTPSNCIVKGFIKCQEELAEYYSAADVFVCTSMADTMPNVCLDSLACGTPVIGFDNTGIPYVADEPLGVFVESGNVRALAAAIKKVQKKTAEDAAACREYALSRYSPDVYYGKMLHIYQNMVL